MPFIRDNKGVIYRDIHGYPFYVDNYIKENFEYIIPKVDNKVSHRRSDFFIITDGPVGSGKSTLSFQIAKFFDPTFNLSRVVFTVDGFLRALIDATPGQAVVFDEAIVVNSRSALTEFNKKVIIAMTQIRSKGLYIIFNIPSVFDLDRNLVLNRCHLLMHCFQDHFGDRGKFYVFDKDKLKTLYLKGKRMYSYAVPKANFVGKFTEYFFLDRNDYENKKQREIARLAENKKVKDRLYRMMLKRLVKYLDVNGLINSMQSKRYNKLARIIKMESGEELFRLIHSTSSYEDEVIKNKKLIDEYKFEKELMRNELSDDGKVEPLINKSKKQENELDDDGKVKPLTDKSKKRKLIDEF